MFLEVYNGVVSGCFGVWFSGCFWGLFWCRAGWGFVGRWFLVFLGLFSVLVCAHVGLGFSGLCGFFAGCRSLTDSTLTLAEDESLLES